MQQESGFTISNHEENSQSEGVDVAIESQFEWQIDHINYDGNESYIRPPEYVDVVAKNVEKIPWQSVVEKSALLNVDKAEDDELDKKKRTEKELDIFDSIREAAREKVIPVAGPWASVAKCLHESMQEVDVLLDTLRIAKKQLSVPGTSETYLNVLQVSQGHEEPRSMDAHNKTRGFCWVSRKKAFEDALKILNSASNVRSSNKASEKSTYFDELKSMRENWRIRKVNDLVFGDLGYRIYGLKFVQAEIFDIFWNPKPRDKRGGCVEVQIPRNLMRRTQLSVSLLKDTIENQNEIAGLTQNGQQVATPETSRNVPWECALKWAQESLINGDIFVQLLRESVNVQNICIVTENALFVSLADEMLLKFERHFHPLQEVELPENADSYLSALVRRMFVVDSVKQPQRAQTFVGFHPTHLPESLDFRGPHGLSAVEVQSRLEKSTSLLKRMIRAANHYLLTDQVVEVLGQYTNFRDFSGVLLSWRWLRCTSTFSMISASFTNQGYEALGKTLFTIYIYENEVHVITKESSTINCHRQMTILQETLSLMAASCQMFSTVVLSKTYNWHVLHANNNAFSKEGTPAPSFYCSNQQANKKLFIQYHTDGRPNAIYLKRIDPSAASRVNEPEAEQMDTRASTSFTPLNCDRVPGSSLMRKLEFLFTMFRT